MIFKPRLAFWFLGFAIMLLLVPAVRAQAPAAPIASQVLTAKKVFISNIGNGFDSSIWSGGSNRLYNDFYAVMKSHGRYQLVTAPNAADLVMEVEAVSDPGIRQLRLRILDPGTGIVIWTIYETVKITGLQKTRDNCLDDAINNLVGDLEALTAQPAAAAK